MKIVQYVDGVVVDIINARNDVTQNNLLVVDSIPEFIHKEGYNGALKFSEENGLYWEYVESVSEQQAISSDEFYSMVEEVL